MLIDTLGLFIQAMNPFFFLDLQEAKVDELEAQLEVTQADLKSARKRIEQLHGALKDHEEFSGDEDFHVSRSNEDSLDVLSSEGSIYSVGDDESLGLSDDDDDDIVMPKSSSSRGLDRTKLHSKEQSPALSGDGRRRKALSPAPSDSRRGSSREKEEEDEFDAARKAREMRLKQLEEEEAQFEAARKARQERLKNLEEEDLKQSRKPKTRLDNEREQSDTKTSSFKRDKKLDSYDDDEDDDDLEEFLLKQRERMKKLEDSDDDEEDLSTVKATRGITSRVSNEAEKVSSHVANGKANGVNSSSMKSESREQSEEPHTSSHRRESVEEREDHVPSRYRRKRQRRRTIEQLVSPEHAPKANGVDL